VFELTPRGGSVDEIGIAWRMDVRRSANVMGDHVWS
jgi:hypothetical protein